MKKIMLLLSMLFSFSALAAGTAPFSDAVRVGSTLYLSGQIGSLKRGEPPVQGGIKAETQQAMENIKQVLEQNGSSLAHIAKCTVMLADIQEWSQMNEVYTTFFTEGAYPARSAFGASGLAFGARVEIECIATLPA